MQDTFVLQKKDENHPCDIRCMLSLVTEAIKERGQNPTQQITEYLISGEPLYITKNGDARNIIQQVDRWEIIGFLLEFERNN